MSQPSSYPFDQLLLTLDTADEEDHALITRDSPYVLRSRQGRRGPGTRGSDVTTDTYALNKYV
jgi:hypothetical protein